MAKLSVVILTYNSSKFIRSCLDAIYAQGDKSLEVVVVDNGSKDKITDLIRGSYPSVILIENKINLGSSKARNQGIEASKDQWLLTLDCDCVIENDFILQINKAIDRADPKLGSIQTNILSSDRKRVYSNGIFISFLRRFYDINRNKPIIGNSYSDTKYIFGACSAAAVYNRNMLEEIRESTGYFDERFFFLVEDVDLSWRAQKKGWKTLYCPQAVCLHFGNSSNIDFRMRRFLCFRNRYLLIIKNESRREFFAKIFFQIILDLPRIIIMTIDGTFINSITEYFRKSNLTKKGAA